MFAALVLFYFVASVVSISEYQAAGQKRLQVQVLSQAYGDATAVYDDAVIDAILDSAYTSDNAVSCNAGASGTIATRLTSKVLAYVSGATSNLTVAFDGTAVPATSWPASGLYVDASLGQRTLSPSCKAAADASLALNRVNATVAFPLNVTSADGLTGAVSKQFNRTYEVLTNYSAASNSFTVAVLRNGVEIRCVNVAC
jgi:hypothetical protein